MYAMYHKQIRFQNKMPKYTTKKLGFYTHLCYFNSRLFSVTKSTDFQLQSRLGFVIFNCRNERAETKRVQRTREKTDRVQKMGDADGEKREIRGREEKRREESKV